MGTVISFAQQKGGAGKTTVLAHLAEAWHLAGRSVAVVDLDPQRSLSLWAGMRPDADFTVVESSGWRAGSDIKQAARDHDVTLVDCPGNASNLLEAALRESHLVVVPCQPTLLDAWASAAVLDMATKEKTPARILLNRVPARGGTADVVRDKLLQDGAALLSTTFGNRVAFSNGIGRGTSALGLSARSTASAEVLALRKELDKLLMSH